MDADVRAILESSYAIVLDCLRVHQPALEALADALLIRETLTGAEAIQVMMEAGLPGMTGGQTGLLGLLGVRGRRRDESLGSAGSN
jgi:hypothetical protein